MNRVTYTGTASQHPPRRRSQITIREGNVFADPRLASGLWWDDEKIVNQDRSRGLAFSGLLRGTFEIRIRLEGASALLRQRREGFFWRVISVRSIQNNALTPTVSCHVPRVRDSVPWVVC